MRRCKDSGRKCPNKAGPCGYCLGHCPGHAELEERFFGGLALLGDPRFAREEEVVRIKKRKRGGKK